METIELLRRLTEPVGVAGDEGEAAAAAASLLAPYGEVTRTKLGSVLCRFGKPGGKRVMLTAHLDEIGLMVTRVDERGFLRVAPCGGIDRRALWGARVRVHAEAGAIPGVICSTPPHLCGDDDGVPSKVEEVGVDVGFAAGEAKKLVSPGDRISFYGPFTGLLNGRVSARALDDRAGCAAILRACELLSDVRSLEFVAALVTMEETGTGGAATSAFSIAPDYAFAVDVSMALTPDDKPEACGAFGEGPMIGFSPVLSRELSKGLVRYAEEHEIPHQREIMAGRTGTDCDAIAPSRAGVRTALLSLPLRYMHTPVEVIDPRDLENTARLIAGYCREALA